MFRSKIFLFLIIVLLIHEKNVRAEDFSFLEKLHLLSGWVVNIPEQFIGFQIAFTKPRAIGFFLDAKSGYPVREYEQHFYHSITVSQAEHLFNHYHLSTDRNWISLNLGVTRVVSARFAIYGGAGYSYRMVYRKYYDPQEVLGDHGDYWIKDRHQSKSKINLLVGFLVNLNSVVIGRFGIEKTPPGVSVGFGWLVY